MPRGNPLLCIGTPVSLLKNLSSHLQDFWLEELEVLDQVSHHPDWTVLVLPSSLCKLHPWSLLLWLVVRVVISIVAGILIVNQLEGVNDAPPPTLPSSPPTCGTSA